MANSSSGTPGPGFPVAFHGGDLDGLLFKRVEAVHVADHQLQRRGHRQHDDAHLQGLPRKLVVPVAQQVPGAHARDHKAARNKGGDREVREAIGERGIEDGLGPGGHLDHAVHHLHPGWCMHPAVGGQDPERRNEGADRHHAGSKQVHPMGHLVPAEQEHAEEGRFEEKGRHHLVGQQWPDEVGGCIGVVAPVGAELERHHDAGHDAHAEHDGENLDPELREAEVDRVFGLEVEAFQYRDIGGKANAEYREDGVERDHECELDARDQQWIEFHRHSSP
jgi:hypothetical protein